RRSPAQRMPSRIPRRARSLPTSAPPRQVDGEAVVARRHEVAEPVAVQVTHDERADRAACVERAPRRRVELPPRPAQETRLFAQAPYADLARQVDGAEIDDAVAVAIELPLVVRDRRRSARLVERLHVPQRGLAREAAAFAEVDEVRQRELGA